MDKRTYKMLDGFSGIKLSESHAKGLVFLLILIFVGVGAISSWYISQQAESILREQKIDALNSIVKTTHESIDEFWLNKHKPDIAVWASDPHIIEAVQKLLTSDIDKEQLLHHPSQKKIRQFFKAPLESWYVCHFPGTH